MDASSFGCPRRGVSGFTNRADEVRILTKSADISYAGCGLPYYVGGMIASREELIVNTPQKYRGLKAYVKATGARRAVVAGAGFIGLEVAENLRSLGLDVTVIDAAMQIMPNAFDAETADYAARKEEGKTTVLTLHDRTPP